MRSRLDLVEDWKQRAQGAGYQASRMAEGLGVTPRLLQTFFRERFGLTPHEWMLRLRMQRAVELLTSFQSVKAVSSELGYKQVSHFSREFKRLYGVSPGSLCFGEVSVADSKRLRGIRSHLDNRLRS